MILVVIAGMRFPGPRSTCTHFANATVARQTTQIGSYDPDEIASVSITQA